MVLRSGTRARDCGNEVQRYRCDSGKELLFAYRATRSTLYSICKAYGANIDEVKSLNDKKDNALSLYEVLKVPYTDPFVQQDDKFYYHKVVKGETFSIPSPGFIR